MIVAYPLDEIWPHVLPKITALRERFIDLCDWTEDDVYRACSVGRAFLFSNTDDDSFTVVKVKVRNGVKILFVWIGCGENGTRVRNEEFLKDIAHHARASVIEMESPRIGFDRDPVWKRGITTYRMEV